MKYSLPKKIIYSIIVAVLLVGLVLTAFFGLNGKGYGSTYDIDLGLDLAGGVSITYQIKEDNFTSQDVEDTIYKLQKRVEGKSTESQVYKEGDNRITVEIPGVTDANEILKELGTPGSLEFLDSTGYSAFSQGNDYTPLLTGSDVKAAQAYTDTNSSENTPYGVQLTFTDDGATKFYDATSANIGKRIYIVYDGEVVSAPNVKTAISGGTASITDMESFDEADNLATYIRVGSIPLTLEEVSSNIVGAQLGHAAIKSSLVAAAIGLALLCLFMIVMFRIPGLVATLSLIIYTALVLFLVSVYDLTLTLPGIAGIILGIGMAVDANCIIFARIREEIGAGKSVRTAIDAGFAKAFSAIIDGNVTTLIAAGVLYFIGSGTVKGFAQTLALGIVVSMFTALVITKNILKSFYAVGLQDEKLYGKTVYTKTFNFIGKRKLFYSASGIVIAIGIVAMVVSGVNGHIFNYSLDFIGGASTSVTFNENYSVEKLESDVQPVVSEVTGDNDIQMTPVTGSNEVIIKTRTLTVDERDALYSKLSETFGVDESTIQTENISAAVSGEMKRSAILSVIIAAIFMLIYVWIRFKEFSFGASSVLPLLHDVFVLLAFYAVLRWTVGNTFIACMLTLVGYSINATIVVFDRIRENLHTNKNLAEVVNVSVTQTLSRSINTSLTTLIMVVVLYILGVTSIKEFALPLIVGVVCGCYSSVCIAGCLWYDLKNALDKRKAKKTSK